jgi:hypothetical protein
MEYSTLFLKLRLAILCASLFFLRHHVLISVDSVDDSHLSNLGHSAVLRRVS